MMNDNLLFAKKIFKAGFNFFRKNCFIITICLLVACCAIMSSTYAKYSRATSISDSARVAVVSSGITVLELSASELTPGSSTTVAFDVTNFDGNRASEVSLSYKIHVNTQENNLPLTFNVESDSNQEISGGGMRATSFDSSINTSSDGLFKAGVECTHPYVLTISWPDDTNANKSFEYQELPETIIISIDATQVPVT